MEVELIEQASEQRDEAADARRWRWLIEQQGEVIFRRQMLARPKDCTHEIYAHHWCLDELDSVTQEIAQ